MIENLQDFAEHIMREYFRTKDISFHSDFYGEIYERLGLSAKNLQFLWDALNKE